MQDLTQKTPVSQDDCEVLKIKGQSKYSDDNPSKLRKFWGISSKDRFDLKE